MRFCVWNKLLTRSLLLVGVLQLLRGSWLHECCRKKRGTSLKSGVKRNYSPSCSQSGSVPVAAFVIPLQPSGPSSQPRPPASPRDTLTGRLCHSSPCLGSRGVRGERNGSCVFLFDRSLVWNHSIFCVCSRCLPRSLDTEFIQSRPVFRQGWNANISCPWNQIISAPTEPKKAAFLHRCIKRERAAHPAAAEINFRDSAPTPPSKQGNETETMNETTQIKSGRLIFLAPWDFQL